jgi:hypothetical protein
MYSDETRIAQRSATGPARLLVVGNVTGGTRADRRHRRARAVPAPAHPPIVPFAARAPRQPFRK